MLSCSRHLTLSMHRCSAAVSSRTFSTRTWSDPQLQQLSVSNCDKPFMQIVRWHFHRKPNWLPRARSKMFIVHDPENLPPDERKEYMRLVNLFKTQRKSIERFYQAKYDREVALVAQERTEFESEVDYDEMLEGVKRHNEITAKEREGRRGEEIRNEEEMILQLLAETEEKEKKEQMEMAQIIQEAESLVKTFIKPEHLDSAIEYALANPVDFDYAIDLNGFIYRGRHTKVKDIPLEEREVLQIPSTTTSNS